MGAQLPTLQAVIMQTPKVCQFRLCLARASYYALEESLAKQPGAQSLKHNPVRGPDHIACADHGRQMVEDFDGALQRLYRVWVTRKDQRIVA